MSNTINKRRRQSPKSLSAYRELFGHFSCLEAIIMDALLGTDGYTREQLADMTGITLASICGRVRGLLDRGLLVLKNEYRFTKAGRRAGVVIINPNLEIA